MTDNWKDKLARIRGELPKRRRPIAKHRRLTRKEVVTQEIEEIVRISPTIKRKRRKKVNFEAKNRNFGPKH